MTDITSGTTGQLATVVQTNRVGILGNCLELLSSLISGNRITRVDNLLQSGTFFSIFGYKFGSFYFTSLH